MDCGRAGELTPWYVAGSLPEGEARDLVRHVAGCATCQDELVQAARLARELRRAFAGMPGVPQGTWAKVAARAQGMPLARVDVGSFLLGLSVGLTATRTGVPVTGRLQILGREVPVFEVGTGGER